MSELSLTTVLEPRGPAAAIILSDAQVAELGAGKRAPVAVTIGSRTARLRLAVMGGENLIGLSKANRAALEVQIGDRVEVRIAVDEAPREVEAPAELAAALAGDGEAAAAYERLSFTHRREYAEWVGGGKQAAARERRAGQALEMLREGRTR